MNRWQIFPINLRLMEKKEKYTILCSLSPCIYLYLRRCWCIFNQSSDTFVTISWIQCKYDADAASIAQVASISLPIQTASISRCLTLGQISGTWNFHKRAFEEKSFKTFPRPGADFFFMTISSSPVSSSQRSSSCIFTARRFEKAFKTHSGESQTNAICATMHHFNWAIYGVIW